MSKKIILACMALVAFAAFALPAVASAKPALCETTENGECHTLEPGVKIHAHNVGVTELVEDPGENALVTCKEATMTGTVTANTGSTIAGDIETASFTGEGGGTCSGVGGATTVHTNIGNGVPWCVHAEGEEDKFSVRGGSCTNEPRPITFVLTTALVGTCKYSRAEPITGTYTTHTSSSEDAILTVTPGPEDTFVKEEGSIFCPSTGRLRMSFTLTTDNEAKTTLYIENNP